MMREEEFEVVQATFHRLDWHIQITFIAWVISVSVIMVGLKLLTANALALSIIR